MKKKREKRKKNKRIKNQEWTDGVISVVCFPFLKRKGTNQTWVLPELGN
jgi:hypothetical protein